MKDLLFILGAAMPEGMIITELKQAIDSYQLNPDKETRGKLEMFCMLLMSKSAVEKQPDGVLGLLKEMDRADRAMDLLNPDKHKS